VTRLFRHFEILARVLAWIGVLTIVVLSVVPGAERPVTEFGQQFEHFTAFALVGGTFAIVYDLAFGRLVILALLFCGGIELLQVLLPTRHARVSDFVIDFAAACFAFGVVWVGKKLVARMTPAKHNF
jgi:VanZ family protein